MNSDLIYGSGDKLLQKLHALFLGIVITDASDEIHDSRISIEFPEMTFKDYARIMMKEKLAGLSISIRLAAEIPGKAHNALIELITEKKSLN